MDDIREGLTELKWVEVWEFDEETVYGRKEAKFKEESWNYRNPQARRVN